MADINAAGTPRETLDQPLETAAVLNYVLGRAAFAHHFHELALGGPHADWSPWYAAHMAETLTRHGYELVLAPADSGIDISADPHEGVEQEAATREAETRPLADSAHGQ